MKLIRVETKKDGIRYITEDSKYRIKKANRNAYWELSEITGHGHKVIDIFEYFYDAKQYLKDVLENQKDKL